MTSLEPRNDGDLIAVKSGINVKYPGLSEYRENIASVDASSLRVGKQINHSIRDDLIQAHNIRRQKNEDKSTLSVTGNSEYRFRYNKPIEQEHYKRIPVTRKDLEKSPFLDLPKKIEKSEYANSFSFTQPVAYNKTAAFSINPTQNVLAAAGGRPLARKVEYDPKNRMSQTQIDHQWPKLEKRELFEWIK